MGSVPPLDVEGQHARLCECIAALRPPIVMDVMRVFLEISSLPCTRKLWSFEFAFDEDDNRIARIEARFANQGTHRSGEAPYGYEVQILLPKQIPRPLPNSTARADKGAFADAMATHGLVARFVSALSELGIYRTIEPLEACSVDVYLL